MFKNVPSICNNYEESGALNSFLLRFMPEKHDKEITLKSNYLVIKRLRLVKNV